MTDVWQLFVGGLYAVATLLLFVLGCNLLYLSYVASRRSRTATGPSVSAWPSVSEWPTVTVQIPIYNELYVAERVIRAAAALDYPADRLQIQVLDDSNDETVALISAVVAELQDAGIDIVHRQRSERVGYKAGALADGLTEATGEFVAIFDADFIPPADFLQRAMPGFDAADVAFVQCRWGYVNRGYSFITKLQALAIDAHFMVEQQARGAAGFWFNFNGTAGIWRVAAINDAGGWRADTLTEDLDLSYRAHLRGWRGRYRPDIEVPSELPIRMSSFRRQQHRWARGSLECAARLLPPVWRSPTAPGVRFQATAHLSAYSIHLLLFLVALSYPFVIAITNQFSGPTLFSPSTWSLLQGFGLLLAIASLAPTVYLVTGQRQLGRPGIGQLPRVIALAVLGSGMMVNTVRAAGEIFVRRRPEFERTAKFGIEDGKAVPTEPSNARYLLDLDRIVWAEFALSGYLMFSAWLAVGQQNWGMAFFSLMFASGLVAVATISILQALNLRSPNEGQEPSRALIVMAKQPLPGASKTRLQPVLSADDAAALAECFILDTAALAKQAEGTVDGLRARIAYLPESAGSYFADVTPTLRAVPQVGNSLAERLDHAMASAIGEGFDEVVAVNSDSPTLPPTLLVEAFEQLQRPNVDVVIGPAEDGGYYLIGWKQRHKRLIAEVAMSTPTVLADTLAIAAAEGLAVVQLSPWYDVDEPSDLERLRAEVADGVRCGPNTKRFISSRLRATAEIDLH